MWREGRGVQTELEGEGERQWHDALRILGGPAWQQGGPGDHRGSGEGGSHPSSTAPSALCPQVLHYVEKPSTFVSDVINCGIYLFSPEALKPLGDVFQRNQQDGQL